MKALARKKLIEVSIPLEAINKASAREKSIRHGHPSTLHLWWARRPLAACRAVLFAQLVDDPSAWPDRFQGEAAQEAERKRLHRVIERLVPWEASNDAAVLDEARWEIARSVAWGRGEEPPAKADGAAILRYLQEQAPPVYDPFSGGGSIPLEAQRLGLRAYGSDLNPVAVLIGKALVEIPPKFAGLPPVNARARAEAVHGQVRAWKGAQGLADDVRYYGQWMRDEAARRIGHLYPEATLPDGSKATVIAWLWARTVRSPDPAAKGAMVPLVSSFLLSTKEGKKAWVEPVLDAAAPEGYRFEVRSGVLAKADEERLREGTKVGRSGFICMLTGASITFEYIREEAVAQGLGSRLMAVIAEGARARSYLRPTADQEDVARSALPEWGPEELIANPSHDVDRLPMYGMPRWRDAFTSRQLVAITTFSDLVTQVRELVAADARDASLGGNDQTTLRASGTGAIAYADAVATYLAFAVDKVAEGNNLLCTWSALPTKLHVVSAFGRQALPMIWDYAEGNPFGESSGNMRRMAELVARVLEGAIGSPAGPGIVQQADAVMNEYPNNIIISTDPPYFDNISYSDISDFFYVWMRHSLELIWSDLFRRLITPKEAELVASPHRHGSRVEAEAFFMRGIGEALKAVQSAAIEDVPLTIYYAFKQSEEAEDGSTSAGWASFLQGVVNAGLGVDGTWPVRTERAGGFRNKDANALASSIVLVCRKRLAGTPTVTRSDFLRTLKREMPDAIDTIRRAGVGPVDMQQSVIGPGMGIFTRYARVLEDDDSPMSVKTALALINRVWEEIENELDNAFDAETQVALAWFATYGFDAKASGELITLANAKNIPLGTLFASGVFQNLHGKAGLIARADLPKGWTPRGDGTPTVWECVQHTARVLNAEDGGAVAAAALLAQMGPMADAARALAYRLFEIATQKGWASEALIYNALAQDWPKLEEMAPTVAAGDPASAKADMFAEAG